MDLKLANKIELAAGLINQGKVIIAPTDTVYGLVAGFYNKEAQEIIYQIKQRPLDQPLIALVASWDDLTELVAEVPAAAMDLMDRFWPGGLTIIFNKKPNLEINPQHSTIGVRWCDSEIMNQLIEECAQPLVATSANLRGHGAPVSVAEIDPQLLRQVDFLLDGGVTPLREESTIVDVSTASTLRIIREGAIPSSAIFLGKGNG